jgi:hypothetical protein
MKTWFQSLRFQNSQTYNRYAKVQAELNAAAEVGLYKLNPVDP